MPEQPKPDLTAYIGMLKHEISEHADKEIERIKKSLIESIDQLLKEPEK